jgi:uncharacterized protein (TIGR02246 family)
VTVSFDPSGDQWEIRQLVERYAQAVDRADPAGVAALFAPDGVLEVWMDPKLDEPTAVRAGRDEIETAIGGITRYRATHHTIASSVADVDGDQASGETRCVAHHIYDDGDEVRDRVLYIRYVEAFARIDGRWQFTRREFHVQWRARHSVVESV